MSNERSRRGMLLGGSAAVAATAVGGAQLAQAQQRPAAPAQAPAPPAPAAGAAARPNILIMFGDDVGWGNISAYNMGMMGYRTPNIDRIGREGAIFTDHYSENSCTAGRAAFICG